MQDQRVKAYTRFDKPRDLIARGFCLPTISLPFTYQRVDFIAAIGAGSIYGSSAESPLFYAVFFNVPKAGVLPLNYSREWIKLYIKCLHLSMDYDIVSIARSISSVGRAHHF